MAHTRSEGTGETPTVVNWRGTIKREAVTALEAAYLDSPEGQAAMARNLRLLQAEQRALVEGLIP